MSTVIAYFSGLNPLNLLNTLPGGVAQGLLWGIMALGVYLTFRLLNFADLSVDGSFACGGAVCIMLILAGWDPLLAMLMSFLAGIVCGIVTGLLHTLLGIPDILAGILTQISLYSINLNIMGKANQALNVNKTKLLITSRYINSAIVIGVVAVAVIIALLYWYLGTEQGSAIRATGINPQMSRAQGINTNVMKVITLALSNGLVALAGGMVAQYQGFADVNMGRGAIVIGLAALIIGEVLGEALLGKHLNFAGRLIFVVIGGVIYYLVCNFVLWLKFPADNMKLLTAIVVAIFLAVPYLKGMSKTSFSKVAKQNLKNMKRGDDNA